MCISSRTYLARPKVFAMNLFIFRYNSLQICCEKQLPNNDCLYLQPGEQEYKGNPNI